MKGNIERSLRTICGPISDDWTGVWRIEFNRELQEEMGMTPAISFVRRQRIHNGLDM